MLDALVNVHRLATSALRSELMNRFARNLALVFLLAAAVPAHAKDFDGALQWIPADVSTLVGDVIEFLTLWS